MWNLELIARKENVLNNVNNVECHIEVPESFLMYDHIINNLNNNNNNNNSNNNNNNNT